MRRDQSRVQLSSFKLKSIAMTSDLRDLWCVEVDLETLLTPSISEVSAHFASVAVFLLLAGGGLLLASLLLWILLKNIY